MMSAGVRAITVAALCKKTVVGAIAIIALSGSATVAEEPKFPVLTVKGAASMTQAQAHVFGYAIPMPNTDKDGHIDILQPREFAQLQAGEPLPKPIGAADPAASDGGSQPRASHQSGGMGLSRNPAPETARPIPVTTVNGVQPMTSKQYDEYTRQMGHLPVMSKSYIFGHTIPMPKTDKNGHINLSDTAQGTGEPPGTARQPTTRAAAASCSVSALRPSRSKSRALPLPPSLQIALRWQCCR
jgi:hypothetical protein